jgi:hypothetical protein
MLNGPRRGSRWAPYDDPQRQHRIRAAARGGQRTMSSARSGEQPRSTSDSTCQPSTCEHDANTILSRRALLDILSRGRSAQIGIDKGPQRPQVTHSDRASSLVMKRSPVRVRASAFGDLQDVVVSGNETAFRVRNGYISDRSRRMCVARVQARTNIWSAPKARRLTLPEERLPRRRAIATKRCR